MGCSHLDLPLLLTSRKQARLPNRTLGDGLRKRFPGYARHPCLSCIVRSAAGLVKET